MVDLVTLVKPVWELVGSLVGRAVRGFFRMLALVAILGSLAAAIAYVLASSEKSFALSLVRGVAAGVTVLIFAGFGFPLAIKHALGTAIEYGISRLALGEKVTHVVF